jgi:hypothetical protein
MNVTKYYSQLHSQEGMVAAVTHDDEWILAMGEVCHVSQSIHLLILVFWKESAVPPGFELFHRIRAKCTLDFDYGKCHH